MYACDYVAQKSLPAEKRDFSVEKVPNSFNVVIIESFVSSFSLYLPV